MDHLKPSDVESTTGTRLRGRRRWLLVPVGLLILWFITAGRLLVAVEGGTVRTDVVVVPSGGVHGDRIVVGARTLLASGSDRLVVFLQGVGPAYFGGKEVADFLDPEGVDPEHVRLLPPGGSTSEEAGTIAALAERCGWRSVTIVTAPYHSRRAGWLFHRALGFSTVVRVVDSGEEFDAGTWWTDDGSTEAVFLEWTKILASAKYLFVRPQGTDPGIPC